MNSDREMAMKLMVTEMREEKRGYDDRWAVQHATSDAMHICAE